MFFRYFGLRHVNAAFGDFAIELAGPKAGRMIIALFARIVGWLRIAAPPADSRNVDRGAISEAEGLRGGGQLNPMLSSDCSQIGTGSSNSSRSANESLFPWLST
jgi:hypothetical protein